MPTLPVDIAAQDRTAFADTTAVVDDALEQGRSRAGWLGLLLERSTDGINAVPAAERPCGSLQSALRVALRVGLRTGFQSRRASGC